MQFEPITFDFSHPQPEKQKFLDKDFDFLFIDNFEEQSPNMSPLPKLSIKDSNSLKLSQNTQENSYLIQQSSLLHTPKSKFTSKKSLHHNFQKHTVTTLKKLISVKSLQSSQNQSDKLAHKMWQIFIKSSGKTKQILAILFGSYKSDDRILAKKIKDNHFSEIIQHCSQQQIRQSQQRLRLIVFQQLASLKLRKHLNQRRISNKQHFQLYLKCFCAELRDGPLTQRLKKYNAQSIQSVLDTNKYLSF